MIARTLMAWAALASLSSVAIAQDANSLPKQPARGGGMAVATRFASTLSLPAKNGPAKSLSLSLGNLSLSGSRRIEVPPMGFYVATLVTADLVTTIGGQRVLRHTGNSWSVADGETMVIELQGRSESAVIEVFAVKTAAQ